MTRLINLSQGRPTNVVDAVRIIYQTLEDISPHVEKIEKTPKPIEPHKTKITVLSLYILVSSHHSRPNLSSQKLVQASSWEKKVHGLKICVKNAVSP